MVGADQVVATQMVVEDGRYTGEIAFYAYGPDKAEAIASWPRNRGYDLAECYAYSDSITDLPMLEAVGHPSAVNPDRALRKIAIERGWPDPDVHERRATARTNRGPARAPRARHDRGGRRRDRRRGVAWYLVRRRGARV